MSENEKKNYSETLNLPKTEFAMRGNLPEKEPKILEELNNKNIYEKVLLKNKGNKPFILHDGPPYANGNIHLGHAFNKILKDIILKYKAMSGFYTPYIPGWDTHGLPIEKKVEQVLGLKKDTVGIPAFRKACEKYALEQIELQKEGFKRLGVLADYENRYVTLDPEFEARQIEVFAEMYKKGYIYRDLKPVYWCEDCATALAEAEIEYEDDKTTSIFVKFEVVEDKGMFKEYGDLSKIFFVIWTTTPWTIPGNQAVTVNPNFEYSLVKVNDEKYIMATELVETVMNEAGVEGYEVVATFAGKDLENMYLAHPMMDKKSRVILGSDNDLVVTLDAGTGCVHTAPGFGHEDYLVCKRYGDIETVVPVDEHGFMTQEAGELAGLKYTEANDKVIEGLEANGHLFSKREIEHSYPHCWRCHKPVIYRATTQWFASVDKFRQEALDAVKTVKWYPAWGEDRMTNMLKDRSDWCISRQRVWGVPIPMFYCKDCGKEIINDETIKVITDLVKEHGTNIWYELDEKEILEKAGIRACACGCTEFKKETDIMDVWFDSGSSHLAVCDSNKYGLSWPADLYLEGNDQYRGWFQSSLLVSVATKGISPYRENVTHGFLIDEDKRKMSKSLGNGVNPLEVCNKFGADILRLWTVTSDYHVDVKVSNDIIVATAEIYKKIRNTARFMLGNLADFDPNTEYVDYKDRDDIDKYAMYKINNVVKDCIAGYDNYSFHTVFGAIHRFCTQELSSRYLDVVKDKLYTLNAKDSSRKSTQSTMYDILKSLVALLAPITFYTAEEIWSHMTLKDEDKAESVLLSNMPKYVEEYNDSELAKVWDEIYEIKDSILLSLEKARADKLIGHPLDALVTIYAEGNKFNKLKALEEVLEMVLIVSKVEVKEGEYNVEVTKANGTKCERCWKYSEKVGEDSENPTICPRCSNAIK